MFGIRDTRSPVVENDVYDFPGSLHKWPFGLNAQLSKRRCQAVPLNVGLEEPSPWSSSRRRIKEVTTLNVFNGDLEDGVPGHVIMRRRAVVVKWRMVKG